VAIVRRTRSTRGLVILLVTVSLVTITIDYRQGSNGPMARLSDGVQTIIIPMQVGISKVFHPVGAFFSALVHLTQNANRISSLEHQLEQTKQDQIRYESLKHQYDALTKLDQVRNSFDFDSTEASVVANGVSNFEWSVTIDKGSNAGIGKGMPVISSQGLVGRVLNVTRFGSTVLLILDPNSSVAARLLESQDTGLVNGQGRGDLRMSSVDQGIEVTVGQPVDSSSYNGGLFPAGIPIGTVSSVTVDPAAGEKDIEVAPLVDFSKLDVVAVVTSFGGS